MGNACVSQITFGFPEDKELYIYNKNSQTLSLWFFIGICCDILILDIVGMEEHEMPEISLFYGIRVTMYYDDHNPPHFHAEYNGNKAIIGIDEAKVIKGALPSRQLKLILAWCVLHQDELMQNWELSKDGKPLNRINPLV